MIFRDTPSGKTLRWYIWFTGAFFFAVVAVFYSSLDKEGIGWIEFISPFVVLALLVDAAIWIIFGYMEWKNSRWDKESHNS